MSKTTLRLLLVGVMAAGLLVAICYFPALDRLEEQLRDWRVQMGLWGLLLLAALFTPFCMVLIPASVLVLLAGYFYDVAPAVLAVSLGTTLAAGVIFLLGRTLARGWVEARFGHHPRFLALDHAVAANDFRIVLLTRLSPLFPYIFLNYAFSLTRVRFRAYLLGTWLGMLPNLVLYVYLGSTIQDLSQLLQGRVQGQQTTTMQLWHTIFTVVGLLATLVVTLMVTRMARQALKQVLPPTGPAREPIPMSDPKPEPIPMEELAEATSV
jgi:uncharacterized membrane protein YdjX (TVP38/TMEM64 family)